MPNQRGELNRREAAFAEAYAMTGDRIISATMAGYAHPKVSAYQALQRPEVQERVLAVQMERINNHLLPLAVGALERILTDPKSPAGAQVQAAKLVFDRALGDGSAAADKAPHEMTGDELARQLERLRQEAAARARPVIDAEPVKKASEPSVFD